MNPKSMTALQMYQAIGRPARLRCDGLLVDVTVMDVKMSYGKARLLVQPIAGVGTVWVEMDRLSILEAKTNGLEVAR
jgi:hypothetical protein